MGNDVSCSIGCIFIAGNGESRWIIVGGFIRRGVGRGCRIRAVLLMLRVRLMFIGVFAKLIPYHLSTNTHSYQSSVAHSHSSHSLSFSSLRSPSYTPTHS
jgi:hypothetical protein